MITVLISNEIQFYTIEPIINNILNRQIKISIIAPNEIIELIKSKLPEMDINYIDISYFEKFLFIKYLHRLCILLLVPHNFSSSYKKAILPVNRSANSLYKILYFISKYTPKWRIDLINCRLRNIFSRFAKNVFPSKNILTVSYTTLSHLLCNSDLHITTIMESWDHPRKKPLGYCSQKVFVWNKELGEDWRRWQGSSRIYIGYPLKLRYALSKNSDLGHNSKKKERPLALYPAGTSSFSYYHWYQEELEVIRDICQATEKAGWDLIIKPKPNTKYGELDFISAEFSHVSIGKYRKESIKIKDSCNYFLDDYYNRERFEELASCDLVINLGTTFGLDATAFGKPVLQLDLRKYRIYPYIAEATSNNHHISGYLLHDPSLTFAPRPGEDIKATLATFLTHPDGRPKEFSEKIRKWLIGDSLPFENAVDFMVNEIIKGL